MKKEEIKIVLLIAIIVLLFWIGLSMHHIKKYVSATSRFMGISAGSLCANGATFNTYSGAFECK